MTTPCGLDLGSIASSLAVPGPEDLLAIQGLQPFYSISSCTCSIGLSRDLVLVLGIYLAL